MQSQELVWASRAKEASAGDVARADGGSGATQYASRLGVGPSTTDVRLTSIGVG
jgi:hypothetical protein